MRLADIPPAPAVIGLILGPTAEEQMRRSLAIAQGDPRIFVSRPLSAVLLVLAVIALVGPRLIRRFADYMARRTVVGARELKTRLGTYLQRVRQGRTLVVTDRGEPVAELRPLPSDDSLPSALLKLSTKGTVTLPTRDASAGVPANP